LSEFDGFSQRFSSFNEEKSLFHLVRLSYGLHSSPSATSIFLHRYHSSNTGSAGDVRSSPLRPPLPPPSSLPITVSSRTPTERLDSSHPSYATFPQRQTPSSRGSPVSSAPNTPARRSFPSLQAVPAPIEMSSRGSGPSVVDRLASSWTRRGGESGSGGGAGGDCEGSLGVARRISRWDEGRYRSPVERAEQEGNPEDWGVLLTAGGLAQQGSSASVSGPGSSLRRRFSRNSLFSIVRDRSASRERGKDAAKGRRRNVTESTLAEEPESYAATLADVEGRQAEDGDEGGAASSISSTAPLLSQPKSHPSFLRRTYSSVFPLSTLTRNILKCVLAYFLAELFTFIPLLSELVGAPWDAEGPVKNAHVIATVAVYIMPHRTLGGMLEADAFLLVRRFPPSKSCSSPFSSRTRRILTDPTVAGWRCVRFFSRLWVDGDDSTVRADGPARALFLFNLLRKRTNLNVNSNSATPSSSSSGSDADTASSRTSRSS